MSSGEVPSIRGSPNTKSTISSLLSIPVQNSSGRSIQAKQNGQRLLCGPPQRHVEEDQRGALQPDVTADGGHPNTAEIEQPRCAEHHQSLCGGACLADNSIEKRRRLKQQIGCTCTRGQPNRNNMWFTVRMNCEQRCTAKTCSATRQLPHQTKS